jgi:hypothetical protein
LGKLREKPIIQDEILGENLPEVINDGDKNIQREASKYLYPQR